MGARESPKFFAIRAMGKAREALLEVGREFAAAGTIDRPDDLCFLKLAELQALSRNEARDWKSLIAGRRAAYERELRRRQVPRVLVERRARFLRRRGRGDATPAMSSPAARFLQAWWKESFTSYSIRVRLDWPRAKYSSARAPTRPGRRCSWRRAAWSPKWAA